jgi:aminopeptidase N
MICNDSPEDKAIFNLDIIVPSDKTCIGSGELINSLSKKTPYLVIAFRLV